MVTVLTLRAAEFCQIGGELGFDAGPNGFDGEARSYLSECSKSGADEFEYRVCS
jgi:hypothetical protein